MRHLSPLLSAGCMVLLLTTGCRRTGDVLMDPSHPISPVFPTSQGVPLLGRPVHLGNNVATGQNWVHGESSAAMNCSLVNLPRPVDGFVQVIGIRNTETLANQLIGIRNTETLANQLMVNEHAFALPITLEQREFGGITPSATQQSPLYRVRLPEGPSQVCLVAGQRVSGDIDDFEVDEILLFAEGIRPEHIAVRRGLTRGTPAPTVPNASPWGQQQAWPPSQSAGGWGWGQGCQRRHGRGNC
ncbi:MAG: hypothetical protein RMJ98_16135 [Myxococcales bacterium]|nr:hypothetical protein [Polyangiaceae bacterium]MDW8250826.1 hypothetical protein [Myxococcales bacterium]